MTSARRAVLAVCFLLPGAGLAHAQAPLAGTVWDPVGQGAVRGAEVRVGSYGAAGGESATRAGLATGVTDREGRFFVTTDLLPPLYIGAGRGGYENRSGVLQKVPSPLVLELDPLPLYDSTAYAFFAPLLDKALSSVDALVLGCNYCHGEQHEAWKDSLHAKAATNPYVLELYAGTNAQGDANVAPGYKLDHPNEAGLCANCHVPLMAMDAPNAVDLRDAAGVAQDGVSCETCHKIREVEVNSKPGVAGAVRIWRPPPSWGLFAFGPYVDANPQPMRTAFQPQMRRSELCSGCHEYANTYGVVVQETYSEWTRLAGDDPDALHCQDCHMKRYDDHDDDDAAATWAFVLDDEEQRDMHGTLRDSREVYPHTFHGASEDYLQEVASLELDTAVVGTRLELSTLVTNVYAGHSLPTGLPYRNILLVVRVHSDGKDLTLVSGPTIPDYGGQLAGQPGKGYAKVLGDGDGTRGVPFWDATRVLEDTRLGPAGEDEGRFEFELPPAGVPVEVSVTLLYRKFPEALAEAKGWKLGQVVMAEQSMLLAVGALTPEPPIDETSTPYPAVQRDGCGASPGRGAGPGWAVLLVLGLLLGWMSTTQRSRCA